MSSVVASPLEVVAETCARFERATGWPLVFTPCRMGEESTLERRLLDERAGRWTRRLELEDGPRGVLYVDSPEAESRGGPGVGEVAGLVGELLADWTNTAAQLARRSREVTTLVEIGRTLSSVDDLVEAIRRLLRAALDLTRYRAASFHLLDPETQVLGARATDRLDELPIDVSDRPLSQGPPDLEALVRGHVSLRRGGEERFDDWLAEGIGSADCVAVPTADGRIGTLWGYDRRSQVESTDRDVDVLRSIAAQLGGMLERTVLREESADQHRRREELVAVSNDWTFDVVRGLPSSREYHVAAASTSRHEIGGDLCEFFPVDEYRSILVVGDACGDSVPGALVVQAVRGMLHGLLDDTNGNDDHLCPPIVVARLNRVLCRVTAESQFASLFYGVIDTQHMTFTYTNAGHPCPLHGTEHGVETLRSHGLLLGVLPDSAYGHETVRLRPRDLIVGFSDGITEAQSGDRPMYRSEGVVRAVERLSDRPVNEVLEAIWGEVDELDAGSADDRTLVVVRVKPEDD